MQFQKKNTLLDFLESQVLEAEENLSEKYSFFTNVNKEVAKYQGAELARPWVLGYLWVDIGKGWLCHHLIVGYLELDLRQIQQN